MKAISSIGEPPSDQSLCECRSPRSARADRSPAVDQRAADLALELGEPGGHPALDGGLDHLGGRGADAGQLAQGALAHPLVDLVAERQDRVRCGPEGLDLVGLGPAALEQEGDPAQRRDGSAVVPVRFVRLVGSPPILAARV